VRFECCSVDASTVIGEYKCGTWCTYAGCFVHNEYSIRVYIGPKFLK